MICDDAHSLAADGDDAAAGWTHCSEMYRNKDGHKKKKITTSKQTSGKRWISK